MKTNLLKQTVTIAGLLVVTMTVLGFGQVTKASAAATPVINPDQIINTGKKYLGVKYRFGAPSNVTYAFDCSSFTQFIFKKNGVSLPRTSSEQATRGVRVAKTSLKKGDLVFFKDPGRPQKIGHVAVYAGNETMLGASGKSVKFSSMKSTYWTKYYVTARRVIIPLEIPQPVIAPPVFQPPVIDAPALEQPAVDLPAVDLPAVDEPTVDQPAVDPSGAQPSVVEQPLLETPIFTAPFHN